MGGHEARSYWDDMGLTLLIAGLLLPPTAWFLDLQVSYPIAKWVCKTGARGVMFVMPAGSLALIAASAWMSWSCLIRLRGRIRPEGASLEDRSYFLAVSGLALSALFALLVLVSLVPRVLANPCD
jgi:hypothetical protein